jgi:hydrogenase nickel incorporation protein HypA/HybF
MHEVGLMSEALDIALEQLRADGGVRIHALTLHVGPLSGVDERALSFAFDVVTQGTRAEGARLELKRGTVKCWCDHCAAEFEPPDLYCMCPRCGRFSHQVRAGREFELVSLEVS